MAQWIPKTAWKVSNLNKRYGTPYVTQGYAALEPGCSLDAYAAAQHTVPATAVAKVLRAVADASPGAVVIDVRSEPERRLRPLASAAVVPLHPHDVLSGAANPILPRSAAGAELFVVAVEPQRAVNTCTALRRWGFSNVSAVSVDAVADAIAAAETAASAALAERPSA